jgi:tRNA(Ile2) C34 agmatinyltransferase TiaS
MKASEILMACRAGMAPRDLFELTRRRSPRCACGGAIILRGRIGGALRPACSKCGRRAPCFA